MTDPQFYSISLFLVLAILFGIYLMQRVETAKWGNTISAVATLVAILLTLFHLDVLIVEYLLDVTGLGVFLLIGCIIGIWVTKKVKMIQMPQVVALLNGIGGAASAIVGAVTLLGLKSPSFELFTALLAVAIGVVTFVGSLIAAIKLSGRIEGRPIFIKYHQGYVLISLFLLVIPFIIPFVVPESMGWALAFLVLLSATFSGLATIRIGGADMPITISLLNALSGVAGAIAGMAINNVLLVAVGGIIGASGLILTQLMCRSMNRKLRDILLGKTTARIWDHKAVVQDALVRDSTESVLDTVLCDAQRVIIVPGYGMALAQAQHHLKELSDRLKERGATVKFAIHPVAGRMPGHMNVLLAEANVDYEDLYELEAINDEFKETDVVIAVGANDVINPAARTAEGTPIYGMPILRVDEAKHVVICNYDLKPGYSGVPNPLYEKREGVTLLLGDAKESLKQLINLVEKL